MDYEVPVSIQQASVSDYEVPFSSNPSYSDHVLLSTNNNQLLATPVTANPTYQSVTTPSVKLESEYYDTFDANKICTKSNTSYLSVDLKTTTTTVSPSVHIKRTNKRIRSYFNEELTNWEYILAALAISTVLITVTAISLALIKFKPKTSIIVTANASMNTSSLIKISCDCPSPDYMTKFTGLIKTTLLIKKEINELRQNKNVSTSDVLKQLNDYMYQIKIINESLQSLITESNKPRVPTLTGLNLTSSITINHGDCVDELWKCSPSEVLGLAAVGGVYFGVCTTAYSPYANDTHIVVSASCNLLPVLPKPMFSVLAIKRTVDSQYVSELQLLKNSTIACACYNENEQQAYCHAYLKKCSYQQNVPQNGTFSVY